MPAQPQPTPAVKQADLTLADRIRIVARTQVIVAVVVGLLEVLLGDQETLALAALIVPAIVAGVALEVLRNTRAALPLTAANLLLIAVLIAVADPVVGQLTGETWTLFQLLPPLAALTFRRPRMVQVLMIAPTLLLVVSGTLLIAGVIPVARKAPPDTLVRSLTYQILVLATLTLTVYRIGKDEQRARDVAAAAREDLGAELAKVQALARERELLAATLEARVAERSRVAEQRADELTRTAAELAHQTAILRSVLDGIGDGVVVADLEGRRLLQNPAAVAILGDELGTLLGGSAAPGVTILRGDQSTPVEPDDLPTARALRGEEAEPAELVVRRPERPAQWVSLSVLPLAGQAGQRIGSLILFRDITAAREAELALQASEERYALASRGANDGLWDWNLVTNKIFFSARWKAMLGYDEDSVGTSPEEWFGRLHPDDQERVQVRLAAHNRRLLDRFEIEYRIAHRDGVYRWMLCRGLTVWDASRTATRMVGAQTDITDRKLAEDRLRYEALHDALTRLPNRALFIDRLEHAIRRAARPGAVGFAVLFMDLDRFKTINDSLGHLAGDSLLIGVARRLEECLRPGDTVARLGGDEFVLLLEPISQPTDAIAIAERIQRTLAAPFELAGQEVFTSASIGIALSSTGYQLPEDVLRDADTAMYQAKLRGKARHAVFDTAMHTDAVSLLQLEMDLRQALERGELRLHYQPIVSLAHGGVVGFEALVRWLHPERGLLTPDIFIALAEDTGLIVPIDEWVLREACRQLAEWQRGVAEGRRLSISVNLSPRQLSHPALLDEIRAALDDSGLEPDQLTLEITEHALVNVSAALETLGAIRALGVRISIDDFGTGYSALNYLHQFPAGTLKIDRSFIMRIGGDEESTAIVTAIIALARAVGMDVVAEGVETSAQRDRLASLECTYGQGWLFARALNPEAAAALLTL